MPYSILRSTLPFNDKWRPALPTLVFLASYIITTVIAATIYMIPHGSTYIKDTGTHIYEKVMSFIGTPTYVILLYLLILVIPVLSLLTYSLIKRCFDGIGIFHIQIRRDILTSMLIISTVSPIRTVLFRSCFRSWCWPC